jgi:hypothetical protein
MAAAAHPELLLHKYHHGRFDLSIGQSMVSETEMLFVAMTVQYSTYQFITVLISCYQ